MKSNLLSILCVFLCLSFSFAQDSTSVKKKAKKFDTKLIYAPGELELLEEAEMYYQEGNFAAALPLFYKLVARYPGEVLYTYRLGVCYLSDAQEFNKAKEFLKQVEEQMPEADDLNYHLAKAYELNYDFEKAGEYYKKFLEREPADNKATQAKQFNNYRENAVALTQKPTGHKVVNLDTIVNTIFSEYAPVFLDKGNVLLYTFRGDTNVFYRKITTINPAVDYYEEVYSSRFENGQWTRPENAGTRFNGKRHNASVSASVDEKKLYLYRNLSNGNDGNLYETNFNGKEFSDPVLMEGINSKEWEGSATTTLDDKTIIFSSERNGGFGGKDLYKSTRGADGKWGTPVNLGPDINTPFDEDGPTLTADGSELYFSSKGHNSMGGYDIFVSKFDGDKFGKAENMGYPINSMSDDIYLFIPLSGDRLYFSSARNGALGYMDIYYVNRNVSVEAPHLIELTGVITANNQDEEAKLKVYYINPDTKEKELQGTYTTNENDGKYSVRLMSGFMYEMVARNATSIEKEEMVDLRNVKDDKVVRNINITEKPIEVVVAKADEEKAKEAEERKHEKPLTDSLLKQGEVPVSGNVYVRRVHFEFNKAEIKDDYKKYLDDLATFMLANKNTRLEIIGHTDSKGSAAYNQSLSVHRAKAAARYLESKGIKAARIKYSGKGEKQLLVDDKGGEDLTAAAKNRRVEFKIKAQDLKDAVKYEE